MKRLSLSCTVVPFPFTEPLRIAGHVMLSSPAVRVTLTDGKHCGRGEANGVFYLNDDVEHMLRQIELWRDGIEQGMSRDELRRRMPPGGARNALDAALWELESQRAGKPVWQLAGLRLPQPLQTTYTLGADAPDILLRQLHGFSDARAIKLKLDGHLDADLERIRLARRTRPDVWLMADANQGYDLGRLDALMPVALEARISLLEQPLPRGAEHELADFHSPIPIAADESLQGLDDLPGLVDRFQVVNIKLDKCGGLTEALLIEAQARRLGLGVMVGNMAGSSLSTAPAFLLGQRCDIVDLDGPVFLAEDFIPCATFSAGRIHCGADIWGSGEIGP